MKTEVYRVILIGMSGVGKSYFGREVASLLGYSFYDTDLLLEEQYGETPGQLITKYGERRFRDLEEQIFADCLLKRDMVLSTGGGIVEMGCNRALLQKEKRVIYLKASPSILAKNLASDHHLRPLLNYENLEESLSLLLKRREKWYHGCSNFMINTDLFNTEEVLAQILSIAT